MYLNIFTEFIFKVVVVDVRKVVDDVPRCKSICNIFLPSKSVKKNITLFDQFPNHNSWNTSVRHGLTYRAMFILLGLNGTFYFWNVIIYPTNLHVDR